MAHNAVAIVGVGTVGTQVAKLAADAGWQVVAIEKDEVSAQAASQRAGLPVGSSLKDAASAAVVIECLPEKHDVKHSIFAELGAIVDDEAVLVTTATALSVTDLALSTGRPNRVLGLAMPHDPARTHAELVRPDFADADAVETLQGFLAAIGREATVVRSKPGYIA